MPWHIPPMTRVESRRFSFTPSWISSLPKKRARPPSSSEAVSAERRVRVLRLEKIKAMLLLNSDCEGRRSLEGSFCGASHGTEVCFNARACWRILVICGAVRSARVSRWGTVAGRRDAVGGILDVRNESYKRKYEPVTRIESRIFECHATCMSSLT